MVSTPVEDPARTEGGKALVSLKECVNDTLPAWSRVRAEGLPGSPRRLVTLEDEAPPRSEVFIDGAGAVKMSRGGDTPYAIGDLVVIAGIFEWGLRVSSSLKKPLDAQDQAKEGEVADFIDLDMRFEAPECALVGRAFRRLFELVDEKAALEIIAGASESADPKETKNAPLEGGVSRGLVARGGASGPPRGGLGQGPRGGDGGGSAREATGSP